MSNSFVPTPPPEATTIGSTGENATDLKELSFGEINTGTKIK